LQITLFISNHNYHDRFNDATLNYLSTETPAFYTDSLAKNGGGVALPARRFSADISQLSNVILSSIVRPINRFFNNASLNEQV